MAQLATMRARTSAEAASDGPGIGVLVLRGGLGGGAVGGALGAAISLIVVARRSRRDRKDNATSNEPAFKSMPRQRPSMRPGPRWQREHRPLTRAIRRAPTTYAGLAVLPRQVSDADS